jgi:transposase-like protein
METYTLSQRELHRAAPAASLEEAGEELLTFYSFPPSPRLALRTTSAIERLQFESRAGGAARRGGWLPHSLRFHQKL